VKALKKRLGVAPSGAARPHCSDAMDRAWASDSAGLRAAPGRPASCTAPPARPELRSAQHHSIVRGAGSARLGPLDVPAVRLHRRPRTSSTATSPSISASAGTGRYQPRRRSSPPTRGRQSPRPACSRRARRRATSRRVAPANASAWAAAGATRRFQRLPDGAPDLRLDLAGQAAARSGHRSRAGRSSSTSCDRRLALVFPTRTGADPAAPTSSRSENLRRPRWPPSEPVRRGLARALLSSVAQRTAADTTGSRSTSAPRQGSCRARSAARALRAQRRDRRHWSRRCYRSRWRSGAPLARS
jgi:hypothetical protein